MNCGDRWSVRGAQTSYCCCMCYTIARPLPHHCPLYQVLFTLAAASWSLALLYPTRVYYSSTMNTYRHQPGTQQQQYCCCCSSCWDFQAALSSGLLNKSLLILVLPTGTYEQVKPTGRLPIISILHWWREFQKSKLQQEKGPRRCSNHSGISQAGASP